MLQSGLETRSNLTVCLVGSPGLLNAASELSRAELTVKEQFTVLGRAGLAWRDPREERGPHPRVRCRGLLSATRPGQEERRCRCAGPTSARMLAVAGSLPRLKR